MWNGLLKKPFIGFDFRYSPKPPKIYGIFLPYVFGPYGKARYRRNAPLGKVDHHAFMIEARSRSSISSAAYLGDSLSFPTNTGPLKGDMSDKTLLRILLPEMCFLCTGFAVSKAMKTPLCPFRGGFNIRGRDNGLEWMRGYYTRILQN